MKNLSISDEELQMLEDAAKADLEDIARIREIKARMAARRPTKLDHEIERINQEYSGALEVIIPKKIRSPIKDTVRSLRREFTVADVVSAHRKGGHKLAVSRASVREIIEKMVANKELRVKVHGRGGRATIYSPADLTNR